MGIFINESFGFIAITKAYVIVYLPLAKTCGSMIVNISLILFDGGNSLIEQVKL